jgi:hypothetical protein
MFALVAQAEEPIDFTQYASCTFTPMSDDKEFRFGSFLTKIRENKKTSQKMSERK